MHSAVGALGVAQEIEDGLDSFQGGLDLVLGSAREDLGLDLAHAGGDLDAAGSGLQVAQVLTLGVVGELRLPRVPVVGVIGVHLGEELLETVGVAAGDHVSGDELAQSLKVLTVLDLGVDLLLSTSSLKVGDGDSQPLGRIWGACGLQVGQELGVDTGLTEDGVDDLLPRGALGDAEGGTRVGWVLSRILLKVPVVALVVHGSSICGRLTRPLPRAPYRSRSSRSRTRATLTSMR